MIYNLCLVSERDQNEKKGVGKRAIREGKENGECEEKKRGYLFRGEKKGGRYGFNVGDQLVNHHKKTQS